MTEGLTLKQQDNETPIQKRCGFCQMQKPTSEYYRKGLGRTESRCRPCHKELILMRSKKKKRKPSPNPYSSKTVNFILNPHQSSDIVNVLLQLLKANDALFDSNADKAEEIKDILGSKNSVHALLAA